MDREQYHHNRLEGWFGAGYRFSAGRLWPPVAEVQSGLMSNFIETKKKSAALVEAIIYVLQPAGL